MSGLDKNRQRNCTVCFRATPREVQMLEARVKASGMPKGKYILESVLYQKISIAVGKYQSDRMSLELQKTAHGAGKHRWRGTARSADGM